MENSEQQTEKTRKIVRECMERDMLTSDIPLDVEAVQEALSSNGIFARRGDVKRLMLSIEDGNLS